MIKSAVQFILACLSFACAILLWFPIAIFLWYLFKYTSAEDWWDNHTAD